jgi:uncharacterized membrane protein YkoI
MIMKKTLIAGTITALILASATVLAMRDHDEDDGMENTVVSNAAMDLGGAVRAAVTEAGGTAVQADTEIRGGKAYYEIKVHTDHGITALHVDPSTGKVTKRQNLTESPREKTLGEQATADGRSLTLADAVAAAEERRGGKATEARVVYAGGRMAYRVELTRGDDDTAQVIVDASDGSVAGGGHEVREAALEHDDEHAAGNGREHEHEDKD